MRYAVLSDIHANAEALRRVLSDAKACGAESVVCLGDIVGYGPMPAEAVEILRGAALLVVAGNHDDAVSGRGDASSFNGLAADAVSRHREALPSAAVDWLRSLPYVAEIDGAVVAHGDFVDPTRFYYVDDIEGAAANFRAMDAQLMFVGHTHSPAIFVIGDSGMTHMTGAQDFTLESNKRYIVNPGSVGYPRDENGVCRSSYVLYDSLERTVEFRFLPFSVSSVMARGRSPSRRRRIAIAAASLGAIVLSVVCAVAARSSAARTETRIVEVERAEDPAMVLATREVTVRPSDRRVRANLKVESGPVELSVEFRDAGGRVVGDPFRRTVKNSYKTAHQIPDGAVSAIFAVRKTSSAAAPKLVQFDPIAASR